MKNHWLGAALAVAVSALFMTAPVFAAPCTGLTSLKLPFTTITVAEVAAAGTFRPAGALPPAEVVAFGQLPAFCRVQGVIAPSSDSHIQFEVWMPVSGWNGKYLGVGNGGQAGSISYSGLANAIADGYATSSTDTGHSSASLNDGTWALGHHEKIIDYGYRAIHETAEKSKAIIRAFYRRVASHAYFSSCSNGGRQGLMEAQRYPTDYDGVIAGDPVISFTGLAVHAWWVQQATELDPASYIPASKWPAVQAAVLVACDARDGLKDGLIDDPSRCDFKPEVLSCQGADSPGCLTAPQITALEKLYAGARDSHGRQIYPGLVPGGEAGSGPGWAPIISGSALGHSGLYPLGQGLAELLQEPDQDFRTVNVEREAARYDAALGGILNAADPDLTAFQAGGGKLILFQGWSDPLVSPLATVAYYEEVLARVSRADAQRFTRLYMVPGLPHCDGGTGPNTFQGPMLAALDHWVEKGVAPQAIIATKYRTNGNPASGIERTRPLCPYPQIARYTGTGSIDVAANFACRAP